MYRILIIEDDKGIAEAVKKQANIRAKELSLQNITTKFGVGYIVE